MNEEQEVSQSNGKTFGHYQFAKQLTKDGIGAA